MADARFIAIRDFWDGVRGGGCFVAMCPDCWRGEVREVTVERQLYVAPICQWQLLDFQQFETFGLVSEVAGWVGGGGSGHLWRCGYYSGKRC